MNLKDYIQSLPVKDREAYATRCKTTLGYMNNHIVHARKEPRRKLREALATESNGMVSLEEVIAHFKINSADAENSAHAKAS